MNRAFVSNISFYQCIIVHFDTGAEGDYLAHGDVFRTSEASEKSYMS